MEWIVWMKQRTKKASKLHLLSIVHYNMQYAKPRLADIGDVNLTLDLCLIRRMLFLISHFFSLSLPHKQFYMQTLTYIHTYLHSTYYFDR